MGNWQHYPIPYNVDPEPVFRQLLALKYPIWLDSCAFATDGRFDILSAEPVKTWCQQSDKSVVITDSNEQQVIDSADILSTIEQNNFLTTQWSDFYFSGLLGFLGYEYGLANQGITSRHTSTQPCAWFGYYTFAFVFDHFHKQAVLLYKQDSDQSLATSFLLKVSSEKHSEIQPFQLRNAFKSTIDYQCYQQSILDILAHLTAGDSYQVNFSQAFKAEFDGDPYAAYVYLRRKNPSEYAAFIRLPNMDILSFSPEVLIDAVGNNLITKPIKGTIARGASSSEDENNRALLQQSEKDKAENMMIVDLLRNDLSKVSKADSVHVNSYWDIIPYPSVFHMVSTISALLASDNNYFDVLKALFPGGSITGAPKHKTMMLIDHYEDNSRGIYCGSIGYLAANQKMCFNIAIRTMAAMSGQLICRAGGGIVIDSDPKLEYQESLDKVKILTTSLKTMTEKHQQKAMV